VGELHFDEDADAALTELERHPSRLLDQVNRWLDRLEADHGDRDLRPTAYQGAASASMSRTRTVIPG
jgi:hypothetical protein